MDLTYSSGLYIVFRVDPKLERYLVWIDYTAVRIFRSSKEKVPFRIKKKIAQSNTSNPESIWRDLHFIQHCWCIYLEDVGFIVDSVWYVFKHVPLLANFDREAEFKKMAEYSDRDLGTFSGTGSASNMRGMRQMLVLQHTGPLLWYMNCLKFWSASSFCASHRGQARFGYELYL